MPGRGKARWVVSTTIWKSPQYITMWERQTWNNVLRTMDQYERLTPSCWVPCLIGHKEVPACLASPVSIQSKI